MHVSSLHRGETSYGLGSTLQDHGDRDPEWPSEREGSCSEGLIPVHLAPYSLKLQPVERVWPLMDDPLAAPAFATLAEVEAALEKL